MEWISLIVIVLGLCLFETISSVDNAIINAQVLNTMGKRARKWFLFWGLLFAVFVVRGLLPWAIIWASNPSIGPIEAFTATFSNDPIVSETIEKSSPMLLMGGGVFLVFLFLHWLFLEKKTYGLKGEEFFFKRGVWFFGVASIILAVIVWFSLKQNPMVAFGAVIGSTAFFITHGFKENAEKGEENLLKRNKLSDLSKIMYLEIIDTTFSIDGVLGAFAFTLSIPLIIIGNGLGAIVVRQLTIGNIDRIKKYIFLKNGAMYSIMFLGIVMIAEGFKMHIPALISPIITFVVVGYFLIKSKNHPNFKDLKKAFKKKKD